jgi:hypothetical protein
MTASPRDSPLAGRLVHWLLQVVVALLAVNIVAFLILGANRPANPRLLPPGGHVGEAGLSGFGAAFLSVEAGPGLSSPQTPLCVLVASTQAEQNQGLMGQTSLHGFAGMAFTFTAPSTELFYMKDTLIPLSIAWFDASGAFVASLDMRPCPPDALCPTYAAGRPYQLALEVSTGRLGSLGIGPGSSAHLGGPCSG